MLNRILAPRLRQTAIVSLVTLASLATAIAAAAEEPLPIADAHVHYSHDSVEFTPPARVIELMRNANLKFALVSSSDDNGTQLLSELAPDLIIPGLRPYRRRGELNTWFTDDAALAYVEKLLETNRYATLGEFHLYGADADLPIPRRIVELAATHNLVLHAHSDADAVTRLLQQNPGVKVLWAHSGFESPDEISAMLSKHDRLWADLAFRSEVGSGGQLSEEWLTLFTTHPDRMMLGTDTFTPERIYFVPEHAEASRVWLQTLPAELAEKIAWKNAHDLLMSHWQANNKVAHSNGATNNACTTDAGNSSGTGADKSLMVVSESPRVVIKPIDNIRVSEPFAAIVSLCNEGLDGATVQLDARMPVHGHGMNYTPKHTVLDKSGRHLNVRVDGLVLHMPGKWQWSVDLRTAGKKQTFTHDFNLQQ